MLLNFILFLPIIHPETSPEKVYHSFKWPNRPDQPAFYPDSIRPSLPRNRRVPSADYIATTHPLKENNRQKQIFQRLRVN